MNETTIKALAVIQRKLHAPKSQTNKFGGYKYRSCEDILEALKPLLGENTLTISDEIIEVGGRVYVKATACFTDESGQVSVSACARESLDRKGMDDSQITGSTSSYARKYALNGLFAIDDSKDPDDYDAPNPIKRQNPIKPEEKPQEQTNQEPVKQDKGWRVGTFYSVTEKTKDKTTWFEVAVKVKKAEIKLTTFSKTLAGQLRELDKGTEINMEIKPNKVGFTLESYELVSPI